MPLCLEPLPSVWLIWRQRQLDMLVFCLLGWLLWAQVFLDQVGPKLTVWPRLKPCSFLLWDRGGLEEGKSLPGKKGLFPLPSLRARNAEETKER